MESKLPSFVPVQQLPPPAFGIVEPNVFRSASFSEANFSFITTLNLKSVVHLSSEMLVRDVRNFMDQQSITLKHLGLTTWQPDRTWNPVNDDLVKLALEFILNADHHPVLVSCTSGIQETGAVVGCLRRLQQWNLTSVVDEYRRYAGSRAKYVTEQFIELFDLDLVSLPPRLPEWYQEQVQMLQEEEKFLAEQQQLNKRKSQSTEVLQTLQMAAHFYDTGKCSELISPNAKFDPSKSLVDVDD